MAQAENALDPARTALLLIDLQPYKLERLPDSDGLLERAASVIDLARSRSAHVVHMWTAYSELDYASVPESNRALLPAIKQRVLRLEDPASLIHKAVAPRKGDLVERKTRVGAFAMTGLDELLTNLGVIDLVVAGAFTGSAILSTVRDAADRDYRVCVLEDCMADPKPEVHDFLLRHILPTQASVIKSVDLDSILGR